MKFGLGFDKAKVLTTAEKYVAQGKIPAAVEEYRKILDHDPKDLTILNIVGDLYLRINKNDEALKCFYKLGELYVDNGFTKNAIAVYRRICRVDAKAIDAVLRLAELYTIQGQLNEARAHYQQAGEYFSQKNEIDKCVDVMEKTLLLDPENLTAKQRLAQMYEQAKRKEDAANMYLSVAEALADRGNPTEADKALKHARDLGLSSGPVLLLQARIQLEDGRPKDAAATLEGFPQDQLDKGALNLLFHAQTQIGSTEKAAAVAKRLLSEYGDVAGLALLSDKLLDAGRYSEALENFEHMAEPLIAQGNPSPLIDGLKKILREMPAHLGALKLLRDVYKKTEQTGELTGVTESLAKACIDQGDFAQARQLFEELTRLDPGNSQHRESLRQMDAKLGRPAAPPPPAMEQGFAELVSPVVVEQPLSAEESELLNTAVTDSDLYLTYHQVDRAIARLEEILGRLPQNITLNQRLLDLYERAGRFDKAAKCAEVLSEVYVMAGDGEKASSYGEMVAKFTERAGGVAIPSSVAELTGPSLTELPQFGEVSSGAEFPVEASPPAAEPPPPPPVVESEAVREVDLSDWEQLVSTPEPPAAPAGSSAPAAPAASGIAAELEVLEFYLQAGLISEATTELARLQAAYPGAPELDLMAERVVTAATAGSPEAPSVQEFQLGGPEAPVAEPPPFAAPPPPPPPPPPRPAAPPPAPPPPAPPAPQAPKVAAPARPAAPPPRAAAHTEEFELALEEPVSHGDEFELSLDEEPARPAPKAPARPPASAAPPKPAPPPPPPPPAAAPPAASGFDSLVGALESELSDMGPPAPAVSHAPPSQVAAPAPPPPQPAATAGAGGLAEVFDEFKAGMEEGGAGAEADIETHFNMGVAFKEMRLFDEAIGEFQKAFQTAQRTRSYNNFVRVCTLLAHCFMEKGLPPLAVRWLENALQAPGLDAEDVMALRYEIGAAHESAGDTKAALNSFMEVYALNIDYRDVADRIRELKAK